MKNKLLNFDILIHAPKKKVWDMMLQPDSYKEWVHASWPESYYEGAWELGTEIKFRVAGHGGTIATITELIPHESVTAEHVAVISADGKEDRDGVASNGWIGTTERYIFQERNGKTTLTIEINTAPDWEGMFNEGWPGALKTKGNIGTLIFFGIDNTSINYMTYRGIQQENFEVTLNVES